MIIELFAAGGLIALASLAGVFTTNTFFRGFFEKNTRYLVSFATGVFAVLTWSLISEFIHEGALMPLLPFIATGALLFFGLTTIMPKAHHHHGPTTKHSHSPIDARRMLLGDALHNIGDGLLLVPLFLANSVLGISAALGVLLHEMVQEIAEFFVLREAGYSVRRALTLNFFVAFTIFIGIGIGIFLIDIEGVALPLLAVTTGGFLYIIFFDLLPSIVGSIRHECKPLPHIILFGTGALLMFLLGLLHVHG